MTLIVETGAGIREANCYINPQFVTSYLTQRGRDTENNWPTLTSADQDARCIASTDYIEKVFSQRFRGQAEFEFDEVSATASISFSGLPLSGETFLLGDETFTFVSVGTGSDFDVVIGADVTTTAAAVATAVNAANSRHATALAAAGVVSLTAKAPGTSGAFTPLSGSVTNTVFSVFSGGKDGGSQPLSFPKKYLYDRQGNSIEGIPLKLKQANAEYAVRAVTGPLLSDPTVDSYGGSIQRRREVIGPITEDLTYVPGTHLSFLIKPFPAADRLLYEFLIGFGQGGVFR